MSKKNEHHEIEAAKGQAEVMAGCSGSDYAMVRANLNQVRDIIALNIGGTKKITAFDLERVRVPDGNSNFWTVTTLEGTKPQDTIEGVVVSFKDMRAWWEDTDPSGKPPQCRSDDGVTGIGSRDTGLLYVDDPVDQPHECSTCRFSQFGSDPKGGRGQWCKQVKAIFILTPDLFLPTVLFLPPTSLKSVERYFLGLGSRGFPFNSVVTSFGLAKEKNEDGQTYNRVEPKRVRGLTEQEHERFRAYTDMIRPSLESYRTQSGEEFRS